jgi:hypothetical protein
MCWTNVLAREAQMAEKAQPLLEVIASLGHALSPIFRCVRRGRDVYTIV